MANRFIINHQSLVSQGISNDAEYQSPYANELLYDSMEEDDDSSLNAAALKQVQYKNLALAKAQSKMLGLSGGHLLNSNSLLSRGQHSGLTGRGSPPSQNNLLSIPKSTLSPTSQASSLHHRPLRLTLSAPGYSISNNPQLQQQQQQILKHNQELLQQQQHLQFLQQQRFQQGQSRYLKQLQQDLLMQQLGKQNFPKVQQAEKEPRGTLKDHLEMLQFQKEQQEQAAKEREKAYQQHKKEQQLAQAARTTEDLPSPRALNEQQIQELLIIQQLQRQDPLQRGGLLQQQLLQHQQLLQLRQAEVQAAPSAASASPSASVGHRPLTRAISMPAVGMYVIRFHFFGMVYRSKGAVTRCNIVRNTAGIFAEVGSYIASATWRATNCTCDKLRCVQCCAICPWLNHTAHVKKIAYLWHLRHGHGTVLQHPLVHTNMKVL